MNTILKKPGSTSVRRGCFIVLCTVLNLVNSRETLAANNPPVLITEFMAANWSALPDAWTDFEDWIEIHNPGDEAVSLLGWYLTDNPQRLDKWPFPDIELAPGEYRVFFASDKNRLLGDAQYHTNFKLSAKEGYLALVNPQVAVVQEFKDDHYPPQFWNVSYGILPEDPETPRYFTQATPNAANLSEGDNPGVYISNLTRSPLARDADDIVIETSLKQVRARVATVQLTYQVMWGELTTMMLVDDGSGQDKVAGDLVFTGVIPAEASNPGEMVRWYVEVTDTEGVVTREPHYKSVNDSEQFAGTVIQNETIESNLPVIHWFIQRPTNAESDRGSLCSLYYNGEFYDTVRFDLHGQSTRSFPKKSFNVDFPRDHRFLLSADLPLMKDFNLLSNWADKSKMRNTLGYEVYRDAGNPYHLAFPVRIQQNGRFLAVYDFVEDGDDRYLERLGLDPNGALYKMYNSFDTPSGEKKTRLYENQSDLSAIVRAAARPNRNFIYDNVDIPGMVNYLAAMIITAGRDCCHKNYYAYRDTEGSGEWVFLPWDVDLSFGRNWNGTDTYFDDRMHPDNGLFVGGNNRLITTLFAFNEFTEMYLRRIRTLMDEQVQPPNTPVEQRKFENRVQELLEIIGEDGTLDSERWVATWGQVGRQTMEQAAEIMIREYMEPRRVYLYTRLAGRGGSIPDEQAGFPKINFGMIEFNPASGNQDEEYIELINNQNVAVDLSGWRLDGGVRFQFVPGTVLPRGGRLFVTPHKPSFRSRSLPPTGNEGNLVVGNYSGHLSSLGEPLYLLGPDGTLVNEVIYEGDPSQAQQFLRVTEIYYNPGPLSTEEQALGYVDSEAFEYIELTNVGTEPLELLGVRFTEGIQFDFSLSPIQILDPGQSILAVRNLRAFETRFGVGLPVAGEFMGGTALANGGEWLKLEDADDSTILEFRYQDSGTWPSQADGVGASVQVVDPFGLLDDGSNWLASGTEGGTPGSYGTQGGGMTLQGLVLDQGEVRFEFDLVPGKRHHVESTTSLVNGTWVSIREIPPEEAVPGKASVAYPVRAEDQAQFFRVTFLP